MEAKIIQHHSPIDFERFLGGLGSQYIGIDPQDYWSFIKLTGNKHSFMGYAEGENRVEKAVCEAIATEEAAQIIQRSSSILLTIIRNRDAERQLTIGEIGYLNEFFQRLPKGCDVMWGISEDSSVGNGVKLVVIANIDD